MTASGAGSAALLHRPPSRRYPAAKEWDGGPLPEKTLLKKVLTGTRGVVEDVNANGVPTLYAYAPMRSQLVQANVVTLLGVPKQVLFAAADRALFRDLGWSALAAGLALLLGFLGSNFLVLRPVRSDAIERRPGQCVRVAPPI